MEQSSKEALGRQPTLSPAKLIVFAICLPVVIIAGIVGYNLWKQHQAQVQQQLRHSFLESMDKRLKDQVALQLLDPDSARFKGGMLFFTPTLPNQDKESRYGTYSLCGSLNAKNRYGGYVGYTEFFSMIQITPDQPDTRDFGIMVTSDHLDVQDMKENIRVLKFSTDVSVWCSHLDRLGLVWVG